MLLWARARVCGGGGVGSVDDNFTICEFKKFEFSTDRDPLNPYKCELPYIIDIVLSFQAFD